MSCTVVLVRQQLGMLHVILVLQQQVLKQSKWQLQEHVMS